MHDKKSHNSRRLALLLSALFLLLLLSGCGVLEDSPSTLTPQGPGAERIAFLWWLLFGLGTAVYGIVILVLLVALFRTRTSEHSRWRQYGKYLLFFGGIGLPLAVLPVVYGFTLNTMSQLNRTAEADELVIEVIGHQWWWEVRYPQYDIVTANELHIPVNRPVQLRLTSADVIHSFWVPELHGKKDLIPGQINEFWIEANAAGVYRGLCAEFCGIQHAKMLFVVVAEADETFASWLANQQLPALPPETELAQAGYEIFMETGCAECHVIAGTPADGDLGPNLTHFAGRLTVGAGIAPNNRGYLAGWIANPHGLKPGNLMPASDLSGPELQALLAYMETLQ